MRVCLDFDGCLHDPYDREPGYRMGKPIPGALEAVCQLLADGHELVIHTARVQKPEHGKHVLDWLAYFGFPVQLQIEVSLAKPLADVYLDDKGLRFSAWPEAMAQLRQLDCS